MQTVPPHIDAIFKEYIGSRNIAIADLQVYASTPVGVGEHPDIGSVMKIKLAEIDRYESLLQTIMNLYPVLNASSGSEKNTPTNAQNEANQTKEVGEPTELYEDGKLVAKFKKMMKEDAEENQNSDS